MKDKIKELWANVFVREIVIIVALAIAFSLIIHSMIQSSYVDGSSMEPNLHDGQRILISKIVYWFNEPERGDIIVFPNPVEPDIELIKRIIGLPGEVVEIKDGVIYIHQADGNTLVLDESGYIEDPFNRYFLGDTIPENNYFVLGDNRNNSFDSEDGWTVSRDKIVGKAWFSTWPPSEWGLVANHSFQ